MSEGFPPITRVTGFQPIYLSMKAAFKRILRANFKNRRFARSLALSRAPESRQNPKEMPHFYLPDSPNAARTAPKVDKNPEKSEK